MPDSFIKNNLSIIENKCVQNKRFSEEIWIRLNKNYKKITNQISKKDIKEWADEESTIDKYKERYKRSWKAELKKSVERMLDEI